MHKKRCFLIDLLGIHERQLPTVSDQAKKIWQPQSTKVAAKQKNNSAISLQNLDSADFQQFYYQTTNKYIN